MFENLKKFFIKEDALEIDSVDVSEEFVDISDEDFIEGIRIAVPDSNKMTKT